MAKTLLPLCLIKECAILKFAKLDLKENVVKELILDGFFRCSGCGRRYHLMDTLESDAFCDECGQSLEPEIEEDQEESDDGHSNLRSRSNPIPEEFPRNGVKYPEKHAGNRPERGQNRSGIAPERSKNSL